jgi:FkbM family methyltransferase
MLKNILRSYGDKIARQAAEYMLNDDRFAALCREVVQLKGNAGGAPIYDKIADINATLDKTPHYVQQDTQIVIYGDGLTQYVPAMYPRLVREYVHMGLWNAEKLERAILNQYVMNGDCAIDVGAGSGFLSQTMAQLAGARGKVHAFEANPELAESLRLSTLANGFEDRIHIEGKAVFARAGRIPYYGIHNTLSQSVLPFKGAAALQGEIACVALDDCFEAGSAINFVRINAGGAEEEVLAGMQRILQENLHIRLMLCLNMKLYELTGRTVSTLVSSLEAMKFVMAEAGAGGALKPVDYKMLNSTSKIILMALRG